MDIKQVKDYFINYLEECNKPATIELQMSSYWSEPCRVVCEYTISGNTLILNTTEELEKPMNLMILKYLMMLLWLFSRSMTIL